MLILGEWFVIETIPNSRDDLIQASSLSHVSLLPACMTEHEGLYHIWNHALGIASLQKCSSNLFINYLFCCIQL